MNEQHFLDESRSQLRKLKELADKALAQIGDDDLFAVLDPESNSIAVIMKHMVGNMRSRWTDFLTSDGEKPDRNRDGEFELDADDSAQALKAAWEAGWALVLETVASLKPEDLHRTIYIRGEAHSVMQAIYRQATHYAGHTGQIQLLAKHYAGPRWRALTIPRGQSRSFRA
ncbi:MAG TPA: DUF1572 family protein [Vicinamibacterales bacterium]|jgi:hypothetical protein|nr:DUF1572 family protein [Vicinamibacterales bacterium]